MYRALWQIRLFEGQVQRLAAAGEIPGSRTSHGGRKPWRSGICTATEAEGRIRSRVIAGMATYSARAATLRRLSPQILGPAETPVAAAVAAFDAPVDAANGVLGRKGVVAAISRLPGARWAAQAQGRQDHQRGIFRDGATGAGAFHETLNLAALWRLPGVVRLREKQWLRRVHEPRGTLQRQTRAAVSRTLWHRHADHRRHDLPAVFAAARHAIGTLRRARAPTCSSA